VSAAVTRAPAAAAPEFAAAGFCGKIPARGDFVGAGLPRAFVDPWHDWIEHRLAASRKVLGESWLAAWLEAPVWRFALAPGLCGPVAAIGLWLPSVDSAGRYFPLTLAALAAGREAAALVAGGGGFLVAAEAAGRAALADDLPPEVLAARIGAASAAAPADPGIDPRRHPWAACLWWTEGAPRVAAGAFALPELPDGARFAAMLDGAAAAP
jgi:type VI secretion system protein ImpM